MQGTQDAKAKSFAQRAVDDHARVSAIFPSQFARCWLAVLLKRAPGGHRDAPPDGGRGTFDERVRLNESRRAIVYTSPAL